jgi:hypothetical protein
MPTRIVLKFLDICKEFRQEIIIRKEMKWNGRLQLNRFDQLDSNTLCSIQTKCRLTLHGLRPVNVIKYYDLEKVSDSRVSQ